MNRNNKNMKWYKCPLCNLRIYKHREHICNNKKEVLKWENILVGYVKSKILLCIIITINIYAEAVFLVFPNYKKKLIKRC